MQNIDISQAQALLPSLLEAVLKKGEEIIFTRDEQPIARLSSVNKINVSKTGRWEPGSAKGMVTIGENFDDPIADFAEYLP